MKKILLSLLLVALLSSIGTSMAANSTYTFINLTKFAEENPIDPKLDFLIKQAAFGANASIDLSQVAPGTHFGEHYHNASDEIDYVIQGKANMTITGEVLSIKSGDLIYLPASTVHSYDILGDENFIALVVFVPPLKESDRTFV
jgi:quercetin dioxygenase-like cupin family protein